MTIPDIYQEERPWGYFRRFCQNEPVTVKIVAVKAGEALSLQSHEKRTEFWRVLKGSGEAEIGDNKQTLAVGEELVVPVGVKHRLTASEAGLEILEISTGDFAEEDITRFADRYGRN